jgi:hypothetical protein
VQGDDYLVPISCSTPARFDRSSDDEIYEMVDSLVHTSEHGTRVALATAQQTFGLNWEPLGLLYDVTLRNTVQPLGQWLRDWMHVMAVSGCGNIELEQMIHVCKAAGVQLVQIQDFVGLYRLPKAHGSVNRDWFSTKRVGKREERDGWKGFAAELLTVVPLFFEFLVVVVQPLGIIDERHIRCFALLDKLLKLFCMGPRKAAEQVVAIEACIANHAKLFAELYPDVVKPKFHHLFHIVDHIRAVGKLLSCFATERRHRMVKTPAANIYGNFETTLTRSQLCHLVCRISASAYAPAYLVRPRILQEDAVQQLRGVMPGLHALSIATSAHLLCGNVHKGDIVMVIDRSVGEVKHFYECDVGGDRSILVLVGVRARADERRYAALNSATVVVQASDILAALIWAPDGDYIRIVLPPASATW